MKAWLTHFFKTLWSKLHGTATDASTLMDSLLQLAIKVVEPLVGLDLDHDGRIAAKDEILATAAQLGLDRLHRLVSAMIFDNLDSAELLRWLAIARYAKTIATILGVDKLPKFRVLSQQVENALAWVTAPDIEADMRSKGLIRP